MKIWSLLISKVFATFLTVFMLLYTGSLYSQTTITESFETEVPPSGWSTAIGSGTIGWARGTDTGLPNGSYFAIYDSYDAPAGNWATLSSPAFDLGGRNSSTPTVSLYFFRGSSYLSRLDYIEVYINTINSLTGATLLSTTGGYNKLYRPNNQAPTATANTWVQYTFNIPTGFNGNSNYIIFKAVSAFGDYLDIDQVQITAYPCSRPVISSTTGATGVGANSYTLGATSSAGTVNWYSTATGGTAIATGTSFVTPNITVTTTYYVDASVNTCTTASRTPVIASVASHYDAGTGISINGTVITNTAPDQTVTIASGNGISATGTYPNFTISNTAPDQAVTITGNGSTTVSGTYPNFTISSTDNNTIYSAGNGINISGDSIINTSPDKIVSLTGSGLTTVTGTYPEFNINTIEKIIYDSIKVSDHIKIGTNSLFLGEDTSGMAGTENYIYSHEDLYIQSKTGNDRNTLINARNFGKLGIGTPDPLTNVHIRGYTNGNMESGSPLSAIIRLEDVLYNSSNDRSVSWDMITSAMHEKFVFRNNGSGTMQNVMTITENGNVGIGADSITYKFEVSHNCNAGISNGMILRNLSAENKNSEVKFMQGNTALWSVGNDVTHNNKQNFFIYDNTANNNYGATRFLIDENGNAGFGVDSLTRKFEISHNTGAGISNGIALRNLSAANKNSELKFMHNNNELWAIGNDVTHSGLHNFFVYDNMANTIRLFIDSAGRVGIGNNTTLQAGMDVTGSIRSSNLSGSGTKLVQVNDNGVLTTTTIDPGTFSLTNYWQLQGNDIFHPEGRVVIGASPQSGDTLYKLVVAGGIKARDIKVKANIWADYVFAKDYKLLPLSELEKYITANKHLPNIPSAKEVTENGLELGSMQQKLLEKVEEQTLYIISLQKQIDELRSALSNKK